jgi:uncharacterized protein YndB with AHSA1/START domain
MKQEDYEADVDAIRREVHTLERDGQAARSVVIERSYDATVDDVWDAITNPERIPRWFLPIEGDLRLGGRYQLQGNAGGEVTACEPPTHLAATWEYGGATSWVDVQVSKGDDGGSHLRLEHVALVEDGEMWQQFGPGAVGIGWDLAIFGLSAHLRTGETVSVDGQPVGEPPGSDVMARSSDAWCAADIASGTPEDDARARADRTLAAYTGTGGEGGEGGDAPDGDGPPDGGGPAAG